MQMKSFQIVKQPVKKTKLWAKSDINVTCLSGWAGSGLETNLKRFAMKTSEFEMGEEVGKVLKDSWRPAHN
jgi:hypothetical protein